MFYFSSNFNSPFMSTQPPPRREQREGEEASLIATQPAPKRIKREEDEEENEVQASQAFSMNEELGLLEKRKNGLEEQLKENEREEKQIMETFELCVRRIFKSKKVLPKNKAYRSNAALDEANVDNFMFLGNWIENGNGQIDCELGQFGIIKYLTTDSVAKFIIYDNILGKAYVINASDVNVNKDVSKALDDYINLGIEDDGDK